VSVSIQTVTQTSLTLLPLPSSLSPFLLQLIHIPSSNTPITSYLDASQHLHIATQIFQFNFFTVSVSAKCYSAQSCCLFSVLLCSVTPFNLRRLATQHPLCRVSNKIRSILRMSLAFFANPFRRVRLFGNKRGITFLSLLHF